MSLVSSTERKTHNIRAGRLGVTEDYSPEDILSVALRELLYRDRGEASTHMIVSREYVLSSIHLSERSQGTGISVNDFSAFSMFGKMQESRLIKILPEIYI